MAAVRVNNETHQGWYFYIFLHVHRHTFLGGPSRDTPNNSRRRKNVPPGPLAACIRLFVKKCSIKRSATWSRDAGQTNAGQPHGTEGGRRLMHAHTNTSRHSSPHRCDPVSLATPRLMHRVSLGSEGDPSKRLKNNIHFKTHQAASFLQNGNDGQWRWGWFGVCMMVREGERDVCTRKQW